MRGARCNTLQRTHIGGQDQFKFALLPRSRVRDTPLDPTPNTGNSGLLGWTALGFRFIRSSRDPCPTAGITPSDRLWIRSDEPVSMFNWIILIGFISWPRHREMTCEIVYLKCRFCANLDSILTRPFDNHSTILFQLSVELIREIEVNLLLKYVSRNYAIVQVMKLCLHQY